MYKAMKYWGKKPHNIWSTYISRYCPEEGIVLDPFVGSGIAAFEAAKLSRRCVAFDLNPLSSFFIEVLASEFEESVFRKAVAEIESEILSDKIYRRHFQCEYNGTSATVFNYRWYCDEVSEVVIETSSGKRIRIEARNEDKIKSKSISKIRITRWVPNDKFPNTPSISHKFIKDLGGNSFTDLWTRRNLYLLSIIFDKIKQVENNHLKLQLLSAFVQTLHLTCRMVYPRGKKSKRDFSGSWGRADYMIRKKSMEQNPLVIFMRSCFDRQGIASAMLDVKKTFPKGISIADITKTRKIKKSCLINYGIVDVADLSKYLGPKSIHFVITDPPYAGLVRYLDLSLIWLVWLKKIDSKYEPDLLAEITIKEGQVAREEYRRRLTNAFKQLHRVLKDEGVFVITFHHQDIREWNEFVNAIRLSGFKFDKVTHQYNRRSGESNVANPYGTSGSDFYIRCVKHRDVDFTNDNSGLEHFILQKAIEIIARRNEPTPYEFIFDGLVPELLQAGLSNHSSSQESVKAILISNSGPGKIFSFERNNSTKSGDIWWFNDPEKHISHPDRPLKHRVEDTIIALLRRKISVRLDDVLAELFQEYPNGLTPDIRAVRSVLEKYAFRSAGNWKINDTTLKLSTMHTRVISSILRVAKKLKVKSFVGRREQSEIDADGATLSFNASIKSLKGIKGYDRQKIERLEMIDVLWIEPIDNKIIAAFEVEHSTDFTSALQRASNLESSVPKFMIIPDDREKELLSNRDPLFILTFQEHNWKYITYSAMENLAGYSRVDLKEITECAKILN